MGAAPAAVKKKKGGAPVGDARMQARYDAYLTALLLWSREYSKTLLAGKVLTTLHGHVFFKNWRLRGLC